MKFDNRNLLITIIILIVSSNGSKILYVSPNGTGTGSTSDPTSIGVALANTTCGDTIILTKGEYYDLINPVNFCNPPLEIIGQGAILTPKPIAHSDWILVSSHQNNADHYIIDTINRTDIVSPNFAYVYNQSSPNDGLFLTLLTDLAQTTSYGIFYNSTSPNIINIRIPAYSNISNSYVLIPRSDPTVTLQSSTIIKNITFYGCKYCIDLRQTNNISIIDNNFYDYTFAINVDSSNVHIERNYFKYRGIDRFKEYNSDTSLLFHDSYYTIYSYASPGNFHTDINISYNTFEDTPGSNMVGIANVLINNNKFLGQLTDILSTSSGENITISSNLVVNPLDTLYESKSDNNNTLVTNNIVYLDPMLAYQNTYGISATIFFYSNDINDRDYNLTFSNNIVWNCYYHAQQCNFMFSQDVARIDKLTFENNIILMTQTNTSYDIFQRVTDYTYKSNLIFSTDSTVVDLPSYQYFCWNTTNSYGPCITNFSGSNIFRNTSSYNFGIDSCFVDKLAENTSTVLYSLVDKNSIPKVGLNILSNWFGDVNHVGPYPAYYNPGRNWPFDNGYNIFKYETDLCGCSAKRTFVNNLTNIDVSTCDKSITTTCPTCEITNSTKYVDGGNVNSLNLQNSNVTISGNVSLSNNTQLVIRDSQLNIIGSLTLNETTTTIIGFNSTIVVIDTLNFNGKLIVNFSDIDPSKLTQNSSYVIAKFNSSSSTFSSVNFIPPISVRI
eukprot:TRINITY_DN749_c0_g4_i4.p1 TRINITY_DN749_c0_g4~~TRINITY_DN749_c0_g4_i4.p1  ORF type:complete len:725 (+),score=78.86 TRINITY_DN749_c0_g4_i4:71-2245(+)